MESLKQFIERHRANSNTERTEDFVEYLYALLDKYGIEKNSEIIIKANLTKQNFSQILSGKVKPSLNTCLKIVFALKANNHECKYLLKKVGYTLASSSQFALIIRYCIENKIYDLADVNEFLTQYGYDEIK